MNDTWIDKMIRWSDHNDCAATGQVTGHMTRLTRGGQLLVAVGGVGNEGRRNHRLAGTLLLQQLVTFLMDEQFTLGTLEALSTQAPDSVLTIGTGSTLKKTACLSDVSRH